MKKERLREIIEALPVDVDLDALLEHLRVLRRIELAEEDIAAGRLLEHADVERRMAKWLR